MPSLRLRLRLHPSLWRRKCHPLPLSMPHLHYHHLLLSLSQQASLMPQAADNTNQAALEKASFDFFFFFHVNISLSKLYNWVACVCVNTIKIPLTRAELSRIKKTGARCQLLVFFFDNININSGSGKRRRKISGHFGTLHIKASAMRRVAEVVEPPTWIPIQLIWLSPQRGPDVKHLIVSVSFLFFFFSFFFFSYCILFFFSKPANISHLPFVIISWLAEFESIDGLPSVSAVKHEVTPCGVQPLSLSASPLPCRILRSPESFMLAQRSVDPLGFFSFLFSSFSAPTFRQS